MTITKRFLSVLAVLPLVACGSNTAATESDPASQADSGALADSDGQAEPGSQAEDRSGTQDEATMNDDTFHSLQTRSLEGEPVDLSRYRGKALLVVNVASECGLTPQYEGLQALHEEIGGDDFAIVAFPSNDFGAQEPGSPAEIREFCSSNYQVSFDMMEKVSTKSGTIYDWLFAKTGQRPTWNFSKYLVSKDGASVQFFDPRTAPGDEELRAAIDRLRGE